MSFGCCRGWFKISSNSLGWKNTKSDPLIKGFLELIILLYFAENLSYRQTAANIFALSGKKLDHKKVIAELQKIINLLETQCPQNPKRSWYDREVRRRRKMAYRIKKIFIGKQHRKSTNKIPICIYISIGLLLAIILTSYYFLQTIKSLDLIIGYLYIMQFFFIFEKPVFIIFVLLNILFFILLFKKSK